MDNKYAEYMLANIVKCVHCKEILTEPKELPCKFGYICQDCIEGLVGKDETKDKFECACKSNHSKKAPFRKSKTIKDAIHKYENLLNFKKQISEIKSKMEGMKFVKEDPALLQDYFGNIKNDIKLRTESLLMKIEKYSDELLDKVDLYEKECEKRLVAYKKTNSTTAKDYNDYRSYYIRWLTNLKAPLIDNKIMLEQQEKEIPKVLRHIDKRMRDFNHSIFGSRKMEFHMNTDDNSIEMSTIGTLSFSPIKQFDVVKCDKRILVDYDLPDFRKIVSLHELANGLTLLTYIDSDASIAVASFNTEMEFINSRVVVKHQIDEVLVPLCNTSYNNYVIMFYKYSSREDPPVVNYYGCIVNENLRKEVEMKYLREFSAVCANEDEIFLIDSEGKSMQVLDWDMDHVGEVEQTFLEEHLGENTQPISIHVVGSKFILKKDKEVIVTNSQLNKIISVIAEDNMVQMFIGRNNYIHIVSLVENEYRVKIYNLYGDEVDNYGLKNFVTMPTIFCPKKNNKFCIFKSENLNLLSY
jgi:hypothetical protein